MTTTMDTAAAGGGGTRAEVVVWLHGEHLSADNPALARYPNAPVVFVFDEPFLREAGFAFQRLFFLYESVMDVFATRAPHRCSICLGKVTEEVIAFARENHSRRIVTTDTIGDRFEELLGELESAGFAVEAVPVPSLVPYDARYAPKRFSGWWREVEADALSRIV